MPFLCYYKARLNMHREEEAYKIYMSNASMHIVNNLAEYSGGVKITKSFIDIINPPPEEKRTADEIKQGIKEKLSRLSK